MNYIERPNLPKNKVSLAAISSKEKDVIAALNGARIGTINIDECSDLPSGISTHADLRLLHLCNNKIICSSLSNDTINKLNILGFDIIETNELNEQYPKDCLLNCAIFGKNIVGNIKHIDKNVLDYANKNEFNLINVNQGYSKCSCLIIDEDAVITSDPSIEIQLKNYDIDVLKIEPQYIYLEGYNNGFIGGVGGMIEKKILATAGNILSLKKDGENIISFLRNRNIYYENLGKNELHDIGGIIPLIE